MMGLDTRLIEALAKALKEQHPPHEGPFDPKETVTITVTVPHELLHRYVELYKSIPKRSPTTPDQ
jgi:hypothetical protein